MTSSRSRSSAREWTPRPLSCSSALADPATAPKRRRTAAAELLAIECDSSDVLKRCSSKSDALTFMPRFIVDDDLARTTCHRRRRRYRPRVRFGAAWLRGRTLGAVGATFLEALEAQ